MREAIEAAVRWRNEGLGVVLATLVRVEGSSPRDPGAMLAVSAKGAIAGSVSSGCIESDVVERAERLMGARSAEIVRYGAAGPFSLDVGLTCGGSVEVAIVPLGSATHGVEDVLVRVARALDGGAPVVLAVRLASGSAADVRVWERDDAALPATLAAGVARRFEAGGAAIVEAGAERWFVQACGVRPEMIVFGAVDFARAVATIGTFLGYDVTVVDARERFATAERMPDADRIVVAWPDEYLATRTIRPETALVILTHDERFDVPLLAVALESPARYVGVMGNRATHARRLEALRELGIDEARLARMHAPIGLDLGARTPEAVAISIAAEILAVAAGRSGAPLRSTALPVRGESAFARA